MTTSIPAPREVSSSSSTGSDMLSGSALSPQHMADAVERLKFFLATAPGSFDPASLDTDDTNPPEERCFNRFALSTGETVSCVLWNGLYHISSTDILRALTFRFLAFGRPVVHPKKFEEGIFSDLRNLRHGTDATLEEPKSDFLELLHRGGAIRTQKKQKVYYWFSVPHDRLFLDALDRDLKREKLGTEPTTKAESEPALSFVYNPGQSLYDQFTKSVQGLQRSENPSPISSSDHIPTPNDPSQFLVETSHKRPRPEEASVADEELVNMNSSGIFGALTLFKGSPSYKQRRQASNSVKRTKRSVSQAVHNASPEISPDYLGEEAWLGSTTGLNVDGRGESMVYNSPILAQSEVGRRSHSPARSLPTFPPQLGQMEARDISDHPMNRSQAQRECSIAFDTPLIVDLQDAKLRLPTPAPSRSLSQQHQRGFSLGLGQMGGMQEGQLIARRHRSATPTLTRNRATYSYGPPLISHGPLRQDSPAASLSAQLQTIDALSSFGSNNRVDSSSAPFMGAYGQWDASASPFPSSHGDYQSEYYLSSRQSNFPSPMSNPYPRSINRSPLFNTVSQSDYSEVLSATQGIM